MPKPACGSLRTGLHKQIKTDRNLEKEGPGYNERLISRAYLIMQNISCHRVVADVEYLCYSSDSYIFSGRLQSFVEVQNICKILLQKIEENVADVHDSGS